MKRALLFLAVIFAAGCGPTTPTTSPYGTSLFVTSRWSSAVTTVTQLKFTGFTEAGTDAFPTALKPETQGTPLSPGVTVRVLLAEDLVGQKLDIVVYGLNTVGAAAISGAATSEAIVSATEQSLSIDLLVPPIEQPFDAGQEQQDSGIPGSDAGPENDAGLPDAGFTDGGRPDAGMPPMVCPSGCTNCCYTKNGTPTCAGNATSPRHIPLTSSATLAVADCGASAMQCSPVCDPLRSVNCSGGACSCGTQGLCPSGTRCAPGSSNTFTCVCDVNSNCPGCCGTDTNGKSVCLGGVAATNCGNAGFECTICVGSCSATGTCALAQNCGTPKCRTGHSCEKAEFPSCRNTSNTDSCTACDPTRSSVCGANDVGCLCGSAPPCSASQYCDRTSGPGTCRALR